MHYGLMPSLVLFEFVFPHVRFRAIRDRTLMFFPRMFGAIVMPNKVAFPRRFIQAFTAITRDPTGTESDERRADTASCKGIQGRRTLSSSGTGVHGRRGIHHFYSRWRYKWWVSDVGVSRRSHGAKRIHWVHQHRPRLDKYWSLPKYWVMAIVSEVCGWLAVR